jgi:hypothetical protein
VAIGRRQRGERGGQRPRAIEVIGHRIAQHAEVGQARLVELPLALLHGASQEEQAGGHGEPDGDADRDEERAAAGAAAHAASSFSSWRRSHR